MRSKILLTQPHDDDPTPLLWRHSVPEFFLQKKDENFWKRLSDPGVCIEFEGHRRNTKLQEIVEEYKQKYENLVNIQDEWIIFTPGGTIDVEKTALICLASVTIDGNWNLDLQNDFERECFDKVDGVIPRCRARPLITGKCAFDFAARNGLERICSVIWNTLNADEKDDLRCSKDSLILKNIPGTSSDSGEMQKCCRENSFINESFVDLSKFSVDAENMPSRSPTPICVLSAYPQQDTSSVPEGDSEMSSSDESDSDLEYSHFLAVKKRRLN